MLKTGDLEKIMKETIKAVDKGKQDIFDISENARNELIRVERRLEETKKEAKEIIAEVDSAEKDEYIARQQLMEVSKNFHRYSEEDIRIAYEEASDKQIRTALLRQQETQLKARRTELELSYKKLKETVARAESLVSRMSVAMDYLNSNIQDICDTLGEMEARNVAGFHIIMAQEEERRRIAREIHDGPAQSVANIILRAEFCQKIYRLKPEKLESELAELKDLSRKNLKDIRKIIFDLRPMDLDDLGLIPALKRYSEEFSNETGITVNFRAIDEQRRVDNSFEVGCFRIVQEFLNNVRKHSGATQVDLAIEITPLILNIKMADNGKGFELNQQEKKETYGLRTMKERAGLLKGELKIESSPGKGTSLLLKIPYSKEGL